MRDIEAAHRRRQVSLHRRADGSGTIAGELTCEAAEYLETLFDTLATPHQGPNGERDPRTPGQRRHDALLGGFKVLYASGQLPTANGCATTLVLTADRSTTSPTAPAAGIVQTAHGYAIPAAVADRWLDPKAKAILVLLSKTKSILAYSDQHRLFTEQQRLAMYARDKGCSYPGCDAPLSWTQAHHVTDYAITRRTRVDDGTLVCTANHATFEKMGWTSIMLNELPHWIPPAWVDPDQRAETQHHA